MRKSVATPFLLLLTAAAALQAADEQSEQLFVRRIVPLFHQKCLACHGEDEAKIKGEFDMRTLASTLKGGESKMPAFVPGKPEESPIYLSITRSHKDWEAMPPKEADKLKSEQVAWIKQWIEAGAPWPTDARIQEVSKANAQKWSAEDGVPMKTVGGLSPEWTTRKYKPDAIWAYQPVTTPQPPKAGGNPIDSFLSAKWPEGLTPAPFADARTFVRRATFDLTGLPPTPEEVRSFENAYAADPEAAIRSLVDKLLASPHYGERMAQHWLDVVRYADSSGFSNDYERGNAWRYRDYVVRAFNADKPYDQFVREQIAGDELDSADPEKLIATGFLRMGPWELTGMEVAKVARQRFLDDVTNSVGETFLAQSLQCARCHDHKFDPIPTRDYYSIQSVFATTQLSEREAPFLAVENTEGFDEQRYLKMREAEYIATLQHFDQQLLEASKAWFAEHQIDPSKWNEAVERASKEAHKTTKKTYEGLFGAARRILTKDKVPENQFPPQQYGFSTEDFGNDRVARKGLERLMWELDRYEPFALAVYNGRTPNVSSITAPVRMPADRMTAGDLEETCILTGGDPFASGKKVKPGVLSVLDHVPGQEISDSIEGRRKAFAQWVTHPKNSLTTRAIVNRIWLWHFGQPIAGNPNNFGGTGKKPTHQELLDWMASNFLENGWSFKAMHRLVMTSDAYRRSSSYPDQKLLAEKDPAGTSYVSFRPRRLSAEEMRDAMLSATAELNPVLGGIPNRPEMNLEAAVQPRQVMGTFASAWVANPLPSQRHRRSLYALKIRGLPDPQLEVFNQPTPDFSCERREASTVTPQVFSLFNSQASYSRALALANRVAQESHSDSEALKRCFQLTFSRTPSEEELQTCLAHWKKIEGLIAHDSPADTRPPLVLKREAVEENTGDKFSFEEHLHAYSDFVPDLQPSALPLHTRALTDVCLALFNSNEFVYVY
ncbi:MAG: PSD1 and planctomycete cytochrome C domain-containing protein [Verrucomicrobiota bacterium]